MTDDVLALVDVERHAPQGGDVQRAGPVDLRDVRAA